MNLNDLELEEKDIDIIISERDLALEALIRYGDDQYLSMEDARNVVEKIVEKTWDDVIEVVYK